MCYFYKIIQTEDNITINFARSALDEIPSYHFILFVKTKSSFPKANRLTLSNVMY